MNRVRTIDAAQGKWRSILSQLGRVDQRALANKHGPCPFCQGRDRFRFDDRDGRGTYICSGCGAGTGMDLLRKLTGWDFKTAAGEIDKIVNNLPVQRGGTRIDDTRAHRLCSEMWSRGQRLADGDPIARYLAGRHLLLPENRSVLRFVSSANAPAHCGGGTHPCMVALVSAADGSNATLHRTYLGPFGKADIADPRATMPGTIPDGAAIRLSLIHGERLGIAEGIETALAASQRFRMPVWAAVNATMLAKWRAPEGVRHVVVFADNDVGFGGQAAAYTLAHRLATRDHLSVTIETPPRPGIDWADVVAEEARAAERVCLNG